MAEVKPHVVILPGGFGPRIRADDRAIPLDLVDALDALAILAWTVSERLGPRGTDPSGVWAELPPDTELLGRAREYVERSVGFTADRVVFRVRCYPTGAGHPPHSDAYFEDGHRLVATGLIYLNDALGGETHFPDAEPDPLTFACRRGRLVSWWSELEDGTPDPTAVHESLVVREGEKHVLAVFLYRRDTTRAGLTLLAGAGRSALIGALVSAASARGVSVEVVDPEALDLSVPPPRGWALPPGAALYNVEADPRSLRVEQLLTGPGVRTTWVDPEGAHFPYRNGPLLLERHGLPIPRTVYSPPRTVEAMHRAVAHLGGFPVVVKVPGGSGGIGVLRVDSIAALASLLDLLASDGRDPLLCEHIDAADTWRVFVVGGRAVGAYRNPAGSDGFRSKASTDPDDYVRDSPPQLADVAVRACVALRTRFGGVDLMVRDPEAGGGVFVLEVNNPAWFGHAQDHGIDVAGALVDLLTGPAAR